MAIFTITYELRGQAKKFDYNAFAEELRKQRCFQIQGNTWLGSFANNATQVHNHFKGLMDKADSLLVSELFQHFCYTGQAKAITKWLELNKPTPLPGNNPEDTIEAGIARARAPQAKPAAPKAPAKPKAAAKGVAKPAKKPAAKKAK